MITETEENKALLSKKLKKRKSFRKNYKKSVIKALKLMSICIISSTAFYTTTRQEKAEIFIILIRQIEEQKIKEK